MIFILHTMELLPESGAHIGRSVQHSALHAGNENVLGFAGMKILDASRRKKNVLKRGFLSRIFH